jgi:uncharacterized protein YprB with RNaseH-like and TPR domain
LKPNILFWDLESSNLNANFGYILCFGYKRLGEAKPKIVSITDFPLFKEDCTNDREVVKAAAKILSEGDVWVTWYGKGFDVPLLNSRLIFHKMKPLPPVPHVDGWWIARFKMRLNSNRLATVSSFLEVSEKTPLTGPKWIRAAAGHRPSIKYVTEHCAQDTVVLEEVYHRIKPLVSGHPNMALIVRDPDACPVCAVHGKMQKRGFSVTPTTINQRYQCQACGAWSKGPLDKSERFSVKVRN